MKATAWGTVLFLVVVAALAFLVEPEDGNNSAYGPNGGNAYTAVQ